MASFYKRFVRDFVHYRDAINCPAHYFIKAIRRDSLRRNPKDGGAYYALHIRRGDLQFKVEVFLFLWYKVILPLYFIQGGQNRCGPNTAQFAVPEWNFDYTIGLICNITYYYLRYREVSF